MRRRGREPDHLLVRRGEPGVPARLPETVPGCDRRAAGAQLPVGSRDRRHRKPSYAGSAGGADVDCGVRGCTAAYRGTIRGLLPERLRGSARGRKRYCRAARRRGEATGHRHPVSHQCPVRRARDCAGRRGGRLPIARGATVLRPARGQAGAHDAEGRDDRQDDRAIV